MDNRPEIWLGHCSLKTTNLDASHDFMVQVGLRPVFKNDEITVLEMRGGTHLIMIANENAKGGDAEFDFMVEDIDDAYSRFKTFEMDISEMSRGEIHDSFYVTEPGGNRIKFNSTHVEDHKLV